jgi:RNA polymerase-binding protein DksA
MIIKRKLPIDLFSRLKEALQKKNKRLDKQQKLLDAEDPYMQAGRAEGNADEVDEAHLEDNFKTMVDAQKDVVGKISENVKKALGKMSKGDYGLCERCGAPIDPARLQAYPEATLCSDCARKEE